MIPKLEPCPLANIDGSAQLNDSYVWLLSVLRPAHHLPRQVCAAGWDCGANWQ